MAIYLPDGKFADSTEMFTAPGVEFLAEGQAVVRTNNNQAAGVLPSTGAATDVFQGFSIAGTSAAPFAEGYANKVETFLVPATGAVTLALTPVAGQVGVIDNTTGSAVTNPTVTGNQVTGLTVGDTVTVTYKYALSVIQARAKYGDVQPGGYSGAYVGQIGVVTRGTIYTDQCDVSKNWAAATAVKLAANGQVTDQSGTGNAIQASIIAVPGQLIPMLGLAFSAPGA
jgi:hypothetical protein